MICRLAFATHPEDLAIFFGVFCDLLHIFTETLKFLVNITIYKTKAKQLWKNNGNG